MAASFSTASNMPNLPVDPDNREAQEGAVTALMIGTRAEILTLARYMQVLSAGFVASLAGRCINIHHSLLPGFRRARHCHRVREREVKLIGATAHFVTADLDEGPIIEQAVEQVDHRAPVDDLIRIRRDIEAEVLACAVRRVAERRVLLNDRRIIGFR